MNKQHGSSLISILIGILISTLTLAAAFVIYHQNQSKVTYIKSHGVEAQDKRRIIVDIVKNHIAMAGYVEPSATMDSIVGLSDVNLGGAYITGAANVTGSGSVSSDTLAYRFQAPASGTINDCTETVVTAGLNSLNSLDIQASSGAEAFGLFCNGVELVNGVQSFSVLYGEDTTGDGSVNRYVVAGTSGLDFGQVVALRITFDVIIDEGAGNIITEELVTTVALRNARLN